QSIEGAGFRTIGDVILASVVDEESAGANGTLAVLQRPHPADAAVYCEGLNLEVHPANLGGVNIKIYLQMRPDQAGVTVKRVMEPATAVYAALNRFGAQREAYFEQDPGYAGTVWPSYAMRISRFSVGSDDGG